MRMLVTGTGLTQHKLVTMSLDQFAEAHDLTLSVTRYHDNIVRQGVPRFTVHFEGFEIKRGQLLAGTYGAGDTIGKAKRDYARQISGQPAVLDAMKASRREFTVPRLNNR